MTPHALPAVTAAVLDGRNAGRSRPAAPGRPARGRSSRVTPGVRRRPRRRTRRRAGGDRQGVRTGRRSASCRSRVTAGLLGQQVGGETHVGVAEVRGGERRALVAARSGPGPEPQRRRGHRLHPAGQHHARGGVQHRGRRRDAASPLPHCRSTVSAGTSTGARRSARRPGRRRRRVPCSCPAPPRAATGRSRASSASTGAARSGGGHRGQRPARRSRSACGAPRRRRVPVGAAHAVNARPAAGGGRRRRRPARPARPGRPCRRPSPAAPAAGTTAAAGGPRRVARGRPLRTAWRSSASVRTAPSTCPERGVRHRDHDHPPRWPRGARPRRRSASTVAPPTVTASARPATSSRPSGEHAPVADGGESVRVDAQRAGRSVVRQAEVRRADPDLAVAHHDSTPGNGARRRRARPRDEGQLRGAVVVVHHRPAATARAWSLRAAGRRRRRRWARRGAPSSRARPAPRRQRRGWPPPASATGSARAPSRARPRRGSSSSQRSGQPQPRRGRRGR